MIDQNMKKSNRQQMRQFILIVALVLVAGSEFSAQELSIAFPADLPPWTIQDQNSGIAVDTVRESFKIMGYMLKPEYMPLKDLNRAIGLKRDGHALVESLFLEGAYSKKISDFQTCLISLMPQRLAISSVSDLYDKRFVAFPNASLLFGKAFQKMAQTNRHYTEIANQEHQIVQLYNGQTDIILADKQIFLYFRKITALTNTSMPIMYHDVKGITEISPAFVVFRNARFRDIFDKGLEKLKVSGEYNNIFYKYSR
jgi:polar amino acid transport system substrate-binding protein